MSVYVDELIKWPNAQGIFKNGSCHLSADTTEELHAFAKKLGLKRSWFQNHKLLAHYDLVPSKREQAIKLGAIAEGAMEGARRRRAERKK